MTELSYYFKQFFFMVLFVRSISVIMSVRPAAVPMHFCLHMCFFRQDFPATLSPSASPMPIRMKKPYPPLLGADTARYLLTSAGYF